MSVVAIEEALPSPAAEPTHISHDLVRKGVCKNVALSWAHVQRVVRKNALPDEQGCERGYRVSRVFVCARISSIRFPSVASRWPFRAARSSVSTNLSRRA